MDNMTAKEAAFFERLLAQDMGGLPRSVVAAGIGLWYLEVVDGVEQLFTPHPEALGLPEDAPISRETAIEVLVHPDDRQVTRDSISRAWDTGEHIEFGQRLNRGTSRYLPFVTHLHPIRDQDGKVFRVIGIHRDRAELQRLVGRMDRAERIAGLGDWIVELPSNTLTFSDGVLRMFGYAPGSDTPPLHVARSHYLPEDRKMVIETINKALATHDPFRFRARIRTLSGELRYISVLGEVELGADGTPVSYCGTIQDVTDEVKREERIRQSQKIEALGTMTGGVAHEINNLLAVVLGNLELLRDECSDQMMSELCEAAIAATLSSSALTHDMLSFARKAQLNPTKLNINDTVKELERWAQRSLPSTISTKITLTPDLWKTDLDKGSLESALLNLIINARDAMPDGGTLAIETSNVTITDTGSDPLQDELPPGRYVMLRVSDTGTGIAPANLERVFEPFFTTKQIGQGTGLGLSMVQGFVKQSSGAIRVSSHHGQGSCFSIYFRARPPSQKASLPREPGYAPPQPQQWRILLVEDEPAVQKLLASILQQAGFEVVTATNSDEAQAYFANDPHFDLLLTDITMPGSLNGPALAKILQQHRPHLAVIFLSGFAEEAAVADTGLSKDDTLLVKPVQRSNLLEAIAEKLQQAAVVQVS